MPAAEYQLEKRIWSESDFDVMGWHDSTIHSLAFYPETFEFALDLDYIFKWVDPEVEGGYYSFWVAPATIVFENVYDLAIDAEPGLGLEVADITRSDPARPKNSEQIGKESEWTWTVECQEGRISFKAAGYKMFVRSAPVIQGQQSLDLVDRGGVSFDRRFKIAGPSKESASQPEHDIDVLVRQFADFLSLSWEQVKKAEVHTQTGSFVIDWLQANWEMLVEGALPPKGTYLEVYGEGADCNGTSSRVYLPDATATHRVVCLPRHDAVTDLLSADLSPLPKTGLVLEQLVTMEGTWYKEAAPFDCVLVDDGGTSRVFLLEDVKFDLSPVE